MTGCALKLIGITLSCDNLVLYFQKWDSDDYRMVRFDRAAKQVNPQWAINLIAEVPPIESKERVVWCDGGSGPEGHPRVFINLVINVFAATAILFLSVHAVGPFL